MRIPHLRQALVAALLPTSAFAAPPQDSAGARDDVDFSTIDIKDAIECRLDAPTYNGFATAATDDATLATSHWKPVKSANMLLAEYELPNPIVVAGGYSTRRIAFTSSGVLAVLDVADPGVIAAKVHIRNTMGSDGLVDALVASGKVTRAEAEAEIKFHKFLGERVISDVTDPADGETYRARTTIALNVSNVVTHPGKTLYGCSYKMELLDKDGNPL
ncbi:hypothetical protein [Sphingomonas sp.]|uniref:hypothetical protein n=1 Tax=Sphingomonas sp. TaxID=28214 RepID=UPI002FD990B3